jgi:hypothetical protein
MDTRLGRRPLRARITGGLALASAALLVLGAAPASAASRPKAVIKVSPAKPVVGDTLILDGRRSRCSPGRCQFAWTSASGRRKRIKLGSARRVSVHLRKAERITIRLRVTDRRMRSATKRLNIVVGAAPPPPAPVFVPLPQAPPLALPAPPAPAPPAPAPDTTAPAAPVISSPADGALGRSSAVALTGTAEPGATIEIREEGKLLATTAADAHGRWVRTLTSLADGRHVFAVLARDAAGNASATATRAVRIDTSAPETTVDTGPGGLTNAATLAFTFSASEPGTTFVCRLAGDWDPCGSPKTYAAPADGAYTFRVRAQDEAGNQDATEATRSFMLDRTAPAVPVVVSPAEGALQSSSTVTLAGTGEPGAAIEVRQDGGDPVSTIADGEGDWTTDIDGVDDGSHTFAVTARDAAGNTSAGATRTVQVDSAVPETTITSGISGLTNAATLTFEFKSSKPGSSFSCRLDGDWEPCVSPKTYGDLPDGDHTFRVRAKDPGGNEDPTEAVRSFSLDRTAPAAPAVDAGGLQNSATVVLSGTADRGSTVELREGAALLATTTADAQGKWTRTLTSVADGSHDYVVTARDAAGNASAGVMRTVRVDTAPPNTTIDSGPAGLTNAAALSYGFSSSETGSTFACELDGDWEPCESPKTYTVLPDGPHTFRVRATDAAGNTDPTEATRAFTLDRTAPGAPTVAGTQNGTAVTLAGSAEPLARIEIREGPDLLATATADAQGKWARALTVSAGEHTFSVTAHDAAGNGSAAADVTTGRDTTAPDTTITAGPSGPTNASPVTFEFSSTETGSTFSCRLDRAGAPGEWEACVSANSFTGLADGDYTFRVRAKDPAGNEDPTEATRAFALDRTPPAAPTIFAPALQNTSTVMLRGTAGPNATVDLRDGTASLGAVTADGQGNWQRTLDAVADGSHTYGATVRDAAGNVSPTASSTVVVDTTAPTTSIDSGPPPLTNAATHRFEFHASEAGSTFACRLDRGTEPGEWALCDSPASYSGLDDGNYTFLVRATDLAGNTEDVTARREFKVDRTAPGAPAAVAPALQNSPTVEITGTTERFAAVEVREDGAVVGTASADSDGRFTIELAAVADGRHVYATTARDDAGNVSPATSSTVVVDTVGPTTAITAGPDGTITSDSATFEFASEADASFECRLDAPEGDGEFAPCSSPFSESGLAVGGYTFQVRATDTAGNTGAVTVRAFAFSPPLSETVYVAPEGDNKSTCSQAMPCASLARAYDYVADGGVIQVGEGAYGQQQLPKGGKRLTVTGVKRPSIRLLEADSDNVTVRGLVVEQLRIRGSRQTYDGVDVDGRFARRLAFEHAAGDDDVFKNGSIGNVTDEKGVIVGGNRFTFDNVVFHDVRVTNESVHNECMYASGAEGLTVRNSTFHACATQDIFFTSFEGGSAWGNVTLENNVFEHATMEDPDSWHAYSVVVHPSVGGMNNWVVRYNTFETGVNNEKVESSGRWVGNLGDWECAPGMTYRHNVGMSCGEADSGVFPAASTRDKEAAFGWVDARAFDFHLKSTSFAIDNGDSEDFPATDRDGNPRNVGWAPDAGAYELQTTEPPDR